jgi:hypothetical protein
MEYEVGFDEYNKERVRINYKITNNYNKARIFNKKTFMLQFWSTIYLKVDMSTN